MNFRNYYNSYSINVAGSQNDKMKINPIIMFIVFSVIWIFCYGTNNVLLFSFSTLAIFPLFKMSSFMSGATVRSTLPIKTGKRILYIYLTLLVTICIIIAVVVAFFSLMLLLNIIFSSNLNLAEEFNDLEKTLPFVPSMYQLSLLFNIVLLYYPLNFIRKVKNFYIAFATSTAILLGYNCIVRLILKLKISTRILSKEEVLSLENPNSVFIPTLIFLGIIVVISFIFCAFVVKKTKQRKYI